MQRFIERQWYGRPTWLLVLTPLSWLFEQVASRRRKRLQTRQQDISATVIVVGNITVGGTGKTPFIIALSRALQNRGYKVGIVSRGYGGTVQGNHRVVEGDSAELVGDEPLFLYRQLGCPVVVGPKRSNSIAILQEDASCDVILSDDGMQHYEMGRDMEIVMIDAQRGLGNARLLPVGPLREAPMRLQEVDLICFNGAPESLATPPQVPTYHLMLEPIAWRNVRDQRICKPRELDLSQASAIAGIGHPQRFFKQLSALGFAGQTQAFADHFAYAQSDLAHYQDRRLLMTEKDAIKCQSFAGQDWWALEVAFNLPDSLIDLVTNKIGSKH